MAVLILAEHDNRGLNPATRSVVGAAARIGDETHLLVVGRDAAPVVEAAVQIPGIGKVLHADAAHFEKPTAENVAATVLALMRNGDYTHLLAAATTYGKGVLPRVAAMLDVAQISDIVAIESPDTFVRPIYAGSVLATVQSTDAVKVITVRTTAFEPMPACGGTAVAIAVDAAADFGLALVASQELTRSDRPDLASARVVIAGGRGIGSAESFKLLAPLADKLNAAIGASRAAVDAGYASNDLQVGQTGKIIAPDLYFAIGISGAIQHIAGMKESKVIVAINKDKDAPIFEIADYGLVGDLFEIVPELTAALESSAEIAG